MYVPMVTVTATAARYGMAGWTEDIRQLKKGGSLGECASATIHQIVDVDFQFI